VEPKLTGGQWILVSAIVAVGGGSLAYRILVTHHLEQTAALFIGLPTFLALFLAITTKAKTATGSIMTGLLIMLLMSGPILGEGFICVLMASPLFLLVGLIIGSLIDRGHRSYMLALPIVFVSLEGTQDFLSLPRENSVTGERIVTVSTAEVGERMARTPRFPPILPPFLRLGFPRPARPAGTGLLVGARRIIHFAGGEGRPGDLILEIVENEPGHVRFRAVSDSSHIAHWLQWEQADITWQPVDASHTHVRWTLTYRRLLDPSWYFSPWERYAVGLAGQYYLRSLDLD
jgi:hypothetical protein